jgi:hypothetical protein
MKAGRVIAQFSSSALVVMAKVSAKNDSNETGNDPQHFQNLMQALSDIRRVVLNGAPNLLPLISEPMILAEQEAYRYK